MEKAIESQKAVFIEMLNRIQKTLLLINIDVSSSTSILIRAISNSDEAPAPTHDSQPLLDEKIVSDGEYYKAVKSALYDLFRQFENFAAFYEVFVPNGMKDSDHAVLDIYEILGKQYEKFCSLAESKTSPTSRIASRLGIVAPKVNVEKLDASAIE